MVVLVDVAVGDDEVVVHLLGEGDEDTLFVHKVLVAVVGVHVQEDVSQRVVDDQLGAGEVHEVDLLDVGILLQQLVDGRQVHLFDFRSDSFDAGVGNHLLYVCLT